MLFFYSPSHLMSDCWCNSFTPTISLSFMNLSAYSPFVSISAITSSVLQYQTSIFLEFISYEMVFYGNMFASIMKFWVFSHNIADWLSSYMIAAVIDSFCNSTRRQFR